MSFSLADILFGLMSSSLLTSLAATNSEFLGCFERRLSIATRVSLSPCRRSAAGAGSCLIPPKTDYFGAGLNSILSDFKAEVPKLIYGLDSMVCLLKSLFIWVWVCLWIACLVWFSFTVLVLSSFCSLKSVSTSCLKRWITFRTVILQCSGLLGC